MCAQRMLNLRYWVRISCKLALLSPVLGQDCFTAISHAHETTRRIGLAVMGIETDKFCPACGTAGLIAGIPGCYVRDPRGTHRVSGPA